MTHCPIDMYDDMHSPTRPSSCTIQDPPRTFGSRAASEPPPTNLHYNNDIHSPGSLPPLIEESACSSLADLPSLASGFSIASGSSNSLGSSMSRRRMASNIPSLASYVSLPSTNFDFATSHLSSSSSLSAPISTPSLCHSLSYLSLRDGPNNPRTPASQLIHQSNTPPEAPRQTNAKSPSRKLSSHMSRANSACYPFTPLEDGMSPPVLPSNIKCSSLSGSEAFLPEQRNIQQTITPPLPQRPFSTLASSCSTNAMGSAADPQVSKQLQRRKLALESSRGSFSGPYIVASGNPLPRPGSSFLTSGRDGLASPLILDSTFDSLKTSRIPQASSLQRTFGSSGSPDYFNAHASKN